ncbi:MAG: GUN4 domain-containing protein [Okeania sp. SIO2H7]|nr:GUN4 domain-containing protein [Okeania sp. SIO2H7]
MTERDIDYVQLETYLRNEEWKKADAETLDMMCKATSRRVDWLDRQAISELPCPDLKTIDALWSQYSQGRFGFKIQQEIFKSTQASNSNVARFGKQVGWTLWRSEFIGFKYYKQLTFDLSAPYGHLPAKWFWMVPWWESVRSGGLGTGRGGCGDDASEMLSAMMYQFLECST